MARSPSGSTGTGHPSYWCTGRSATTLVEAGWGADLGFPALILDVQGAAIDVLVFESADLPAHWSRLDEFEGPGYERVATTVSTAEGDLATSIYIFREQEA